MAKAAGPIPLAIAPSAFEAWANVRGYSLAPAVVPAADRVYADRHTQQVFDAWCAGRNDDAIAVCAMSLIDMALHFRLDPKAVKCLHAALEILSGES